MPNVATKNGSPIVINGVVATNCECCSCYYLRPAVCCDDGPGPVRYRVYGTHTLLDTFATSGDPLYIVLRPDGFALGAGLDYTTTSGGTVAVLEAGAVPTCWIVETSTECDEGELLEWTEFNGTPLDDPSGGEYSIGNITDATVLYDDEFFPAPDPCDDADGDDCPVIICDECVSTSAVISTTLAASVYSDYLSTDVTLDGDGTQVVGCDGATAAGEGENPPVLDSSPYPSSATVAYWHWYVGCDGSGVLYLTLISWETPTGVLRGQGNATFDAAGNVTPVLEVAITFPATVTATWSVSSPVAWTKVGSDCVVEEAP